MRAEELALFNSLTLTAMVELLEERLMSNTYFRGGSEIVKLVLVDYHSSRCLSKRASNQKAESCKRMYPRALLLRQVSVACFSFQRSTVKAI